MIVCSASPTGGVGSWGIKEESSSYTEQEANIIAPSVMALKSKEKFLISVSLIGICGRMIFFLPTPIHYK
jgi:hypothetical protein